MVHLGWNFAQSQSLASWSSPVSRVEAIRADRLEDFLRNGRIRERARKGWTCAYDFEVRHQFDRSFLGMAVIYSALLMKWPVGVARNILQWFLGVKFVAKIPNCLEYPIDTDSFAHISFIQERLHLEHRHMRILLRWLSELRKRKRLARVVVKAAMARVAVGLRRFDPSLQISFRPNIVMYEVEIIAHPCC